MNNINISKKRISNKRKTSVVMWVLKWLTVQSKKWGSLKGFDNKEYVVGECNFNVYKNKWNIEIKDKNWFSLPCIKKSKFKTELEVIRRLEKGIKYPCKKEWESNYKETKIFCNYLKFC